jgi:hypothetical protein
METGVTVMAMLLGTVAGFWTAVMVLHAAAVLRDRRDLARMRKVTDDIYPFIQLRDVLASETMPATQPIVSIEK